MPHVFEMTTLRINLSDRDSEYSGFHLFENLIEVVTLRRRKFLIFNFKKRDLGSLPICDKIM